ncbi:MAG: tRNA lysidine(34) synthetase TilS [Bacteroidales bacterium]|jgi:tRNA(Ile)-lysidine synthase|nr:tRNA lysidine(34) synthetase TilS [Bacteroidales bacterium]
MLREFKKFISDNRLFDASQKILLAVSGGLDSTVMAYLFYAAELQFGIAHCNFQLRGEESNGDENFVRDMARRFNVPFYVKKFNTIVFAKEHKTGIQEAARKLRYDWFADLIIEEEYDFLATAHHKDDHIETFFINLLRGCGISGLHGILSKKGNIIRPLLFATRDDIEKYSRKRRLSHREDSSNQQIKYTRNKIRHLLIPALKEINPDFQNIINDDIARFQEAEKIYQTRVSQLKNEIVSKTASGDLAVDIKKLHVTEAPQTVLFEILSFYGFKKDIIPDIFRSMDGQSGKRFFSSNYQLLKDRDFLFLSEKKTTNEKIFIIEKGKNEIFSPLHLKIEYSENHKRFIVPRDRHIVCFDCDQLIFPLTIRAPKDGDQFVPFGMKGHKKLSDFFIDEKFSQIEKGNTLILCSGSEIIWVVNHRRSNLYKVESLTKNVISFISLA